MALFKSDDATIPESRANVFANMELNQFLEETPLAIYHVDGMDWDFQRDGEKIYMDGTISVPVRLVFKEGNLKNDKVSDDMVLIDVEICGESQLGIRFEKPKKEAPLDPLASVDVPRTVAEAQKKAWE